MALGVIQNYLKSFLLYIGMLPVNWLMTSSEWKNLSGVSHMVLLSGSTGPLCFSALSKLCFHRTWDTFRKGTMGTPVWAHASEGLSFPLIRFTAATWQNRVLIRSLRRRVYTLRLKADALPICQVIMWESAFGKVCFTSPVAPLHLWRYEMSPCFGVCLALHHFLPL